MSDPRSLTEIGPYRIESRLGAGGMGEVYRAYDSRLDRSVAVKLIRPESSGDGVARERFRREARAAAGLSHPSIVQIYDILEFSEGDALVMELVEGDLLSQRIAQGPLEITECVRLAHQVAEGLAAAHRRGILHRDLKAENVLITPEGHAKILDFGLAKRVTDESEASLTRTGGVVGTFRAMSPEQARGQPLGPQSDLFSLGVLLYEMLTGRSPFRADAATDTLVRVCTARQMPVRELRPGVPEGLSTLVDRLLEKDPALRPQSAREAVAKLEAVAGASGAGPDTPPPPQDTLFDLPPGVFTPEGSPRRWGLALRSRRLLLAAVLLLAAAGAAALLLGRAPREPLYVAVTRPRIVSGKGPGAEVIAASLRVALIRGLGRLEGISPLAREEVEPVPGSPVQVARATAASEVLGSQMECEADTCRIFLTRFAGKDGAALWAATIEVPLDHPFLVEEAVEAHLRESYRDYRVRRDALKLEVRPDDYADYVRLLRSFDESQDVLPASAMERLATIRRSSPRFLDAFIFEANSYQHRFQFQRDPADLERAADLLRQARELAPGDPRPLRTLFEIFLKAQQLDRAGEVLRELERLQPGSASVRGLRARLLDQQGKGGEALQVIREVVRHNPSWRHLFWGARIARRNGQSAEARRYLEELLARFPDYVIGKSMLGELELLTGNPARAVEIYADLVRRAPEADELVNFGLAYLLLHRYQEAEEKFRQALELRPRHPLVALNLADVYLLRGKTKEAEALYTEIVDWAQHDPAASQVPFLSTRAQALAHLGRRREAVELTQEILRVAPDDPQVAVDISLVYTLVGDQASALVSARKALEGGVEPRWFEFPWFAPLRSSSDFQELVPAAERVTRP